MKVSEPGIRLAAHLSDSMLYLKRVCSPLLKKKRYSDALEIRNPRHNRQKAALLNGERQRPGPAQKWPV